MTRTFTIAIMAAVMYVFFRDGDHKRYQNTARAARELYDAVKREAE